MARGAGSRSYPITQWPAGARARSNAPPMRPTPITATFTPITVRRPAGRNRTGVSRTFPASQPRARNRPTRVTCVDTRAPSGLFPAGPPRPTYREPHPVRMGPAWAGAGVGALWQLLIGLLAYTIRGDVYLALAANGVADHLAIALMH